MVVLIHGLTGAPNEMDFMATYLNEQGYSVLCPRLANHGAPIDVLKTTTWRDCYRSVRDAFLQLETANLTGPIFISGLSFGGLLALVLAEEFQGRIAGVSCLSPPLFYDGWNTRWFHTVLMTLIFPIPLRYATYWKEQPPYGIKNQAIRQRVHQYYSQAKLRDLRGVDDLGYPYIPASLFYENWRLGNYLKKRLATLTVPIQLIQAKDDDITSVRNSIFIYDRVKSATKELVLLEDSYHAIVLDQERHVVAQEMEKFFGRLRNAHRIGTQ